METFFYSYGGYIIQLIRFARVSSHVSDIDAPNKILTGKLLNQGCRYQKLQKLFKNFIADTMPGFLKIQDQMKVSFATGPIKTRSFV